MQSRIQTEGENVRIISRKTGDIWLKQAPFEAWFTR